MMKSTVNVGLIGCGQIALSVHLRIIARLPGVRVSAIAEPDAGRRQQAAALAPSATAFENADDLLDQSDVDAVVISLPSALHAEAAIAAFAHQRHVYLEKPLATNSQDGRRVIEAWRIAQATGMMGFNYRFCPLLQKARQMVESGATGEPISVCSTFTCGPRPLPTWKTTRQTGGGVLLDLASHHVDLVQYLFDRPVEEVSARIAATRCEGDTATLDLRLGGGLLVQSFFSLSAIDEHYFEIYGQGAKLTIDRYRDWAPRLTESASQWSRFAGVKGSLGQLGHISNFFKRRMSVGHEPSYHESLLRFVRSVRGERVDFPDLLAGYRSLEVIEAAEESARTGATVTVKPWGLEAGELTASGVSPHHRF